MGLRTTARIRGIHPLAGDAGWAGAGIAVYAMSQWLLILGIVNLAGIEQLGGWAYSTALVTPLALLGGLKLRSAVASDLSGEGTLATYRGVGLVGAAISMTLILALGALPPVSRGVGGLIILLGGARVVDALTEVEYGWLQRAHQFRTIAVLIAASALLSVAGVVGALWSGGTLTAAAVVVASISVACHFVARLCASQSTRGREVSLQATLGVRQLALRILPLGGANALNMFNVTLPRLVLEWTVGRAGIGIYAALQSLLSAAGLPATAVAQASIPRLAWLSAHQDRDGFHQLLRRLNMLGAFLGLTLIAGTLVVGTPIVGVLYGPDAAQHPALMIWIACAIAVGMSFTFLGTAANARRMFREQLVIAGLVAVVSIPLQIIAISSLGMLGAGIATLVTTVFQCFLYVVLLGRTSIAGKVSADDPVGS